MSVTMSMAMSSMSTVPMTVSVSVVVAMLQPGDPIVARLVEHRVAGEDDARSSGGYGAGSEAGICATGIGALAAAAATCHCSGLLTRSRSG